MPVVKFHADCSRCQGWANVRCYGIEFTHSLFMGRNVTVHFQTGITFF